MSKVIIKVQTQCFENYSDTDTPYWKPKGGQEFHFPTDSDWVVTNDSEGIIEAIVNMLADYSNEACKYEYLDHDVDFHGIIVLQGIQLGYNAVLHRRRIKNQIDKDAEVREFFDSVRKNLKDGEEE
jgi:hypothetical protein